VLFEPVADLVLAVGGLQRRELLRLRLGHLLGDLVLNADEHLERRRGELAVGEHGQLVPHLAHALAQVGHRACGRPGRVVELVGQPCGQLTESQQLLPLSDDLALPQAADHVPLEQVHRHREFLLHELSERRGIEHEEPRRPGDPHRRLIDVILARDVGRPGTAVDAALRRAVGLDVDAC
jgi:hypothetical protein